MSKKFIAMFIFMAMVCFSTSANAFSAKKKVILPEYDETFEANSQAAIESGLMNFTLYFASEPETTMQLRVPHDRFINYIKYHNVCGKNQQEELDNFAKNSNVIKVEVECSKITAYSSRYFY